jgi:hypothetical protein
MTESSDGPPGGVGHSGGSAPYPSTPQPYWGFSAPPANPKNGLGIASFIVAIIGILVSLTLVGGVILGSAAVIMGAVARTRVRHGQATNGGVAIAGIVLGIVAAVLPVIIAVAVVLCADLLNGDYQHCLGYHPGHEESCDRYH